MDNTDLAFKPNEKLTYEDILLEEVLSGKITPEIKEITSVSDNDLSMVLKTRCPPGTH